MTLKVSITSQHTAVETAKRALASPASNCLRGNERRLLIDHLDAVTKTLEFCQTYLPEIKAFMAEKKNGSQS